MPTWGEGADILMALAIVLSAYVQWRKLSSLTEKIEVVHKATNSMHDEIVNLTRAEGIAEGKAQEAAAAPTHETPLPVTDNRVATATEKMAVATDKMADAVEAAVKKSS